MKNSEPILADYLKINRFNAQYEKRIGGSDPDFSIWDGYGKPFAYWDVKDRKFTPEDQRRLDEAIHRAETGQPSQMKSGPDEAYDFIRRKIEFKAKQFEKCGAVPGMMVLAEWAGCVHPTPEMVGAALEGWPTLIVTVGAINQTQRRGRVSDGTMWDEQHRDTYRSVSAIGFLEYVAVNRYKYGLNAFAEEAFDRFGVSEHAWGLVTQEERRQRQVGIDLDYKEPVLEIYRIRNAHHPWPSEAVGRFDRVYTYDEGSEQYVLTNDGLVAERKIALPITENHLTIESIMSSSLFRA